MKRNFLVILLSVAGIFMTFFLESLHVSRDCLYGLDDGSCNVPLFYLEAISFIAFPVFLFAIVTVFSAKVANSWRIFTYWYCFIFVLFLLFIPESGGGGGWISGGSLTKATYGLLLSALYFVLSIVVITRKLLSQRTKKA